MHTRISVATRLVLMLTIACASLLTLQPASAQPAPPPTRQVIAHGVDALDGSTMTWQVNEHEAGTDVAAGYGNVATGFSIATDAPIVISDASAMQSDYFGPGSARFHANGSSQLVVSSNDVAASYSEITLTNAEAGSGYSSEPFETPTGTRAISLTRGFVPTGSEDTFRSENEFPYLVHVTDGAIAIVDGQGTTHDVAAGGSVSFSDSITMSAEVDSTYVIAAIGPEVSVPPFPQDAVGSLTVTQFDCPIGVDPTVDASTCTPVVEPWGVVIHPSGLGDDTSADLAIAASGPGEQNSWTWTEVSVGTWHITPAAAQEGEAIQIAVTGATLIDDHYNAEIIAGETTEVTIYLVGERLTGEGWLDLYVFTCDAALTDTPPTESPGCVPSEAGAPSFTISRVDDQSVNFTEADAVLIEAGLYRVNELPAGDYSLSFSAPAEGDLRAYDDNSLSLDGVSYGVTIPTNAAATVMVATGPESDTAGEGTAVFAYYTCPQEALAGDGTVDLDPLCTSAALPGTMTLTATDGIIYETADGSLVVPAGNYQVSAQFAPAGDLYVVGSVTVSSGETATVYIADVVGEPSTPAP